MGVTRRQVLGGIGAATAAGAVYGPLAAAGAADVGAPSPGFESGGAGAEIVAALTLTPGLAYATVDPTAFGPLSSAAGRLVNQTNGTRVTTGTDGLCAPLPLPAGSVLREVHVAVAATVAGPVVGVWKKPLTGPWVVLNNPPAGRAVALGPGVLVNSITLDDPNDGSSTYMVLVNVVTATNGFVHGAVVGYVPPPRSFVPLNPVPRVLDTRSGPKIGVNETRTVSLGIPGFATAAVINLTATETEGATGGFLAAFPANVAWPGNSSLNWSGPDQNVANGVITATDPAGAIKVLAGSNRTHVVIDVQGYLL